MNSCKILKFIILLASVLQIRGSFICQDGSLITRTKLCDGKKDCEDGSDEIAKLCFHLICPRNKFRCQYGGCVDKGSRCNQTVECADSSDEHYCNFENKCSDNKFECLYDGNCINENLVCNGLSDCLHGSDETEELCVGPPCPDNMFRCRHGGCIYQDLLCDKYLDCPDGSDEIKSICEYLKCKNEENCPNSPLNFTSCEPIESTTLDAVCTSKELESIDCNQRMPFGATAKLQCSEFYLPIDKEEAELQCQIDGFWNSYILKCVLECGQSDPYVNPLIVYGRNKTNWPWHAVMYLLQNEEWTFACGGTLISEAIVLTAAHCTWKKPTAHIKFAFGKYYSDFNLVEFFTQIRDVHRIYTPPEYLDYRSNYGSDIAAVFLSKPIELSIYVRPACLDWNLSNIHRHLTDNYTGTSYGGENKKSVLHTQLVQNPPPMMSTQCGTYMCPLVSGRIKKLLIYVKNQAAHCTWKKPTAHIKFAFGKYYSDFNLVEFFTQIRDVHRIYTPPEYLDYRSNYGSDIAAVFLSKPIELSIYIRPACLDWNLSNIHRHLTDNYTGTIAGMGLTANDNSSKTLQALDLPVVSSSRCIENQQRDFKKYVTYTTFCAGWANGTSVCNGDSGGGLLFKDIKNPDRWILQGLVSVSPRRKGSNLCDTSRYVIFTKIGLYLNWLKNIIGNYKF